MTKQEKFKAGLWVSAVPYVSGLWSDADWIQFIDDSGRWFDSDMEMFDLYGPEILGEVGIIMSKTSDIVEAVQSRAAKQANEDKNKPKVVRK